MPQFTFLPQWPFPANSLALFGGLLLAGILGGELTKRVFRLPRITGYVLVGMVLGAEGVKLLDDKLIGEAWIFVDIALGIVLFELGRRLDLGWFRRDPWLLATGLAESALAFACIYFALVYFDVKPLYAAVAAAVGISTSPAVVMLVAQELKAEGQVTERALHLTALNSAIAFVLVTILHSGIHQEYRAGWTHALLHPLYLLSGSLLIGLFASLLALALSRWLGKHQDLQYMVLLGLVVAMVGVSHMLALSAPLSLLAFGVLVRHLDARHDLNSVDMGRVGQPFFVVLFVVTGANLAPSELATGGALALVYILARFVGKAVGVMSLTHFSGVRPGAAGLLTIALMPMSSLALAMVQGTVNLYPEFGAKLAAIVLSAVLILEIIGPLAVQFALRRAGDAEQKQ